MQTLTTTNHKSKQLVFLKKPFVLDIISGLFILLFVYTGISKLSNTFDFQIELSKSPLIGKFAPIIAWGLPIFELLVATLLIVPKTNKIGLYISAALMLFFTAYLTYMIYFTPTLPCTCGGVLSQMTWKQHLLFNLFYLALGLAGVMLIRKHEKNNT